MGLGQRGIQGEASGADRREAGRAPLGAVASGERGGQGGADYRRRVEAAEVEGAGSQRDAKDPSGEAGDGRATEARNDLDDSGDRPAIAHGKLEKPEQQALFGG